MYSPLIPFENVVQAIKDATGIKNLRNLYPELRRYIYRAQREIGFGGAVMLKKIKYSTSSGTIICYGNKSKIKLPEDIVSLEEIGTCKNGLCPEDYKIQGNWLFICKPIQEFTLIYYTNICDGEGNPAVTENHFEAVVSGIKFFMYQPKMWNNEGNMNMYKYLEKYYSDRIGEAIGSSLMPTTQAEWSKISQSLKMSYRDIMIYSSDKNCYCCIEESPNENENPSLGMFIYFWQYEDLISNIDLASNIDLSYLETKLNKPASDFYDGELLTYITAGRIAFAVKEVDENYHDIKDVLNNTITNIVFDTYYNSELKTQIYVSKEYYVPSSIYFKFIKK